MRVEVVFFVLVLSSVVSSNYSRSGYEDYFNMDYKTRQHRLLSFNTDESGDVSVELAFNVPFLTIPVKKSVDSVKGAMANVNVGAVALTGGLILATVGLLPAISWLISKKSYGSHYTYRNSDETVSYFTVFDEFLAEKNLEPLTCLQKMVCWTVKRSRRKVGNGRGGSVDKIIDGLVSSEWLRYFLNKTALKQAIEDGIQESNCTKVYSACKINRSDLEMFMSNLFGDSD